MDPNYSGMYGGPPQYSVQPPPQYSVQPPPSQYPGQPPPSQYPGQPPPSQYPGQPPPSQYSVQPPSQYPGQPPPSQYPAQAPPSSQYSMNPTQMAISSSSPSHYPPTSPYPSPTPPHPQSSAPPHQYPQQPPQQTPPHQNRYPSQPSPHQPYAPPPGGQPHSHSSHLNPQQYPQQQQYSRQPSPQHNRPPPQSQSQQPYPQSQPYPSPHHQNQPPQGQYPYSPQQHQTSYPPQQQQQQHPSVSNTTSPEAKKIDEYVSNIHRKVNSDPRLCLLQWKYNPKLDSIKACLQKAKIAWDPSHIPFFGLSVKVFRAGKSFHLSDQLDKASFMSLSQTQVSQGELDAMRHNMSANVAQANAKATFSVITEILPGNKLVLFGLRKGAESGVVKVTRKMDGYHEDEDDPTYSLHRDFLASKAFFTYLGLPFNDDPLFRRWERERLFLKCMYGAIPEEDLRDQEPGVEEVNRVRDVMKSTPDNHWSTEVIGHHPLWFFWRAYECWSGLYWDKHMNFAWKVLKDPTRRDREDRDTMRCIAATTARNLTPHVRIATEKDLPVVLNMFLSICSERKDILYQCFPLLSSTYLTQSQLSATFEVLFTHLIKKERMWVYQTDLEVQESFDCLAVWNDPKDDVGEFEKKKLIATKEENTSSDFLKKFAWVSKWRSKVLKKFVDDTGDVFGLLHFPLIKGTKESFEHVKILMDALCDEAISVVAFEMEDPKMKLSEKELKFFQKDVKPSDVLDFKGETEKYLKEKHFSSGELDQKHYGEKVGMKMNCFIRKSIVENSS